MASLSAAASLTPLLDFPLVVSDVGSAQGPAFQGVPGSALSAISEAVLWPAGRSLALGAKRGVKHDRERSAAWSSCAVQH